MKKYRESHPSGYLPLLRKANVDGVFVPEDRETLYDWMMWKKKQVSSA
ncbi:MAG: hypothetical protein ABII26_08705 [Pseudomonadota bacterium]